MSKYLLILSVLVLVGCGLKGPLERPEGATYPDRAYPQG
jgi:predicted small lipoprotein YifL